MARPGLYTPKQLTNSPLAKHTDPKDQPQNEGQKRSPCHKTSKAHNRMRRINAEQAHCPNFAVPRSAPTKRYANQSGILQSDLAI